MQQNITEYSLKNVSESLLTFNGELHHFCFGCILSRCLLQAEKQHYNAKRRFVLTRNSRFINPNKGIQPPELWWCHRHLQEEWLRWSTLFLEGSGEWSSVLDQSDRWYILCNRYVYVGWMSEFDVTFAQGTTTAMRWSALTMAQDETAVQHKPQCIPAGSGDRTHDPLIGSLVL